MDDLILHPEQSIGDIVSRGSMMLAVLKGKAARFDEKKILMHGRASFNATFFWRRLTCIRSRTRIIR